MRTLLLLLVSAVCVFDSVTAQTTISKPVIEKTIAKSYNGSEVSCGTANDGEITVIASGGSGKFLYSKDEGRTFQASNVFPGLVNNQTYAFFVKDAVTGQVSNGKWVTIKHLNPVTISSQLQVISQPKCFGSAEGVILITAYGGTGTLKYSLNDGEMVQNDGRFSGLKAGSYRVTISDINGCSVTSNEVGVRNPAPLGIEVSLLTQASCNNPFGSIKFRGTGSTGDYKYSIDGQPFIWKSKNEFHTFSNLSLGNHQITVMDNNNGCSFNYNFTIQNNLEASLSAGNTELCQGQSADMVVTIKRGAGLMTYKETYTVILRNDNGDSFPFSNLLEGANNVSVSQLSASTSFMIASIKSTANCTGQASDNKVSFTVLPVGTWMGKNTNWFDAANWSCGVIPSLNTNVRIQATANNPVIAGKTAQVANLYVEKGAQITVSGRIKIGGEVWTAPEAIIANEGQVEFAGEKAQWIKGSQFSDRTIKNLVVSNGEGLHLGEGQGDTLNVTGNLTFGSANGKFYTGDNLTLKSGIHGTANVGVVREGNKISGKVIVERYINTGTDAALGQHPKAWMLLATPTIGSTIFESWQESGKSTGKAPIENNQKGYGVLLTTAHNKVPSNGYDLYTGPGSSIKTFQSATGTYDRGPESTFDPVYNENGYMILVRGDRSVYTSKADAVPVVLRTKGELITGEKEVIVPANKWASIGNPYASRIYLNKIERTGGVDEFVFVWDPKLGGNYGLGAFQTLYKLGSNYYATPGGGSYGRGPVTFIESGQAFFVQSTGKEGSVRFTENAKQSSTFTTGRGDGSKENVSFLKTTIYGMSTGTPVLADGNLIIFGDYSEEIDGFDARKIANSAENFSILSRNRSLALESRPNIATEDTIRFQMSGMVAQTYRMEIEAEAMNRGLQAWLVDNFTKTETPLNLAGTTGIEFTVSGQKGAAAADRFQIIFKPAFVLPVVFTDLKASVQQKTVLVEWTVASEDNLNYYEVEKSNDGINFSSIARVAGANPNGGKYISKDAAATSAYQYYRIRTVDMDGKTSLSGIVRVALEGVSGNISAYPNPVTGNTLYVQLDNQQKGTYHLRLLNPVGQVVLNKTVTHAGGNYTEKLQLDNSLPRGIYHLEVSNIQSGTQSFKILF